MHHWRLLKLTPSIAAILAALAGANVAAAQGTAVVRGTVTDSASGQPIQNAQVMVVGTTIGALTSAAGTYTLRGVPARPITVRAQLIGYAPSDRAITPAAGDTAVANFIMRATVLQLGQVVVVGYGTASRRDLSAASATVSGAEITNTPVAGVDQALQGKAPGVQVIQNAGNPGVGISVRVRGSSSISASNQPLYVVDGVPIISDNVSQLGFGGQDVTAVTSLNPNEIESITVLKDAASAAIYGSRGSNGVVLITTKRGRPGESRISFDVYTGWQTRSKEMSMLNASQYVEYFNEAEANDGYEPEFTPGVTDATSTDWQNAIFRTAPVSNFNLAVSGGSDRVRYNVSGTYFDQQGVVLGSSYKRAAARVNLDFNASSRLAVRTSLGLTDETNNRLESDNTIEGAVTNAVADEPIYPIRNPDGKFSSPDDGLSYANPVALAVFDEAPARTLRALGNVEAKYNFTGQLSLTGRLGMDVLTLNERRWESQNVLGTYSASVGGAATQAFTSGNRYVLESFLTYDRTGSSRNRYSLTGGASVEYNNRELNYLRGEGFSSTLFRYVGNAVRVPAYDGASTANNLVSVFSRANVTLADRYLFGASLRADGSSRFGENNRYGIFPAASVGWVISEEPVTAGAIPGNLKLRASYGVTGNQGINNFASLRTFATANYGNVLGTAPANFGNPDLRWESTREFDAGLDWYLFGGRVGIVADYYNKLTSNLLVSRPIPASTGFTIYTTNVGNIRNRGVELGLSTQNIVSGSPRGFSWSTDFNISANRNRVVKLYKGQEFVAGLYSTNMVREGEPLGAFYMLRFTGVDPATGDAMYYDKNGDGEITADDRVIVGSPQPKYFGGVTNTLSYAGFDLRAFVNFSQGAKVFNAIRVFADDGGYYYDNKLTEVLDRWQKPGDITDEPRASYDGTSGARRVSSHYLEDASFIRLQELTLGYRLPERLTRLGNFSNARIYVSGRNLWTSSDFTGYNPEANSNGSDANISLGTEFYSYPLARTIQVGISGTW